MPLDSKAGKPLTAEGGSMRLVENQLVTTAVPKAGRSKQCLLLLFCAYSNDLMVD
jgi:hypothetical protein